MRTFSVVLFLAVTVSLAFAGGHCGGSYSHCDRPDWAYSYTDPHYMPDCAPKALKCFYDKMIPMMEARRSHESAYLRENAECMYRAARRVLDADDECCCAMHKSQKHYRRAAKDLVRDCDELREIVFGGSSSAVYEQMKQVEEDFVRLSNLCE
jgi:hypothetical protein